MFARKFAFSATAASLFLNAAESQGVAGAEPVAAPKLTAAEKRQKQIDLLTKRIADDSTKLTELKLEAETSERLASVGTGSVIVARIGRAETSRNVEAVVLGVKTDDNTGAVRYKISFGEGFDADTQVIQPSQIVSVQGDTVAPVDAPLTAAVLTVNEYGQTVDEYGQVVGA